MSWRLPITGEGALLNTKDFDTREAVLNSGRQEFLINGFDKASLRTICKNAQVTTGAFYSYFSRKEELFSAIVDPMLKEYFPMYDGVIQSALADIRNCEQNEVEVIEFILAHRDEFRLLFDCSAGTKYEGFREELMNNLFMSSYQKCFDRYAGFNVSPKVIKIFVHMKFAQYMELIYGGYDMTDIRKLIRQYAAFTEAGFTRLIEELKKRRFDA